jgi:alkaline phosphatase D
MKKLNADHLLNKRLNRRNFLGATKKMAGVLAGMSVLGPFSVVGCNSGRSASVNVYADDYPFKLGVASGDPHPDGVVLWTRLAPDPLKGDGGMPAEPVKVKWEVARDKEFRNIVKQGTEVADPSWAHAVHAEVEGLEPESWYYYRFKVGKEDSSRGRTKTAPRLGEDLEQVKFAFISCQSYTGGYYTAYDHLIKEDLDIVFFLGDYIYEGKGSERVPGRTHLPYKTIYTLNEYRIRYGQYKSDPSLQAAHAAFPWIVTLDDHEVKNNWGGQEPPYDTAEFLTRRAAAFRAYYENMPLRKSSMPDDIEMQLYRKFSYGNLVEFSVLDTRQYRSAPACGGKNQTSCTERFDPSRTILGDEQENWLFDNLKSSSAHWNVLAQQVILAEKEQGRGAEAAFGMDKWDGYVASRKRLFDVIKTNNLSNLVVLTGDSHQNWVNDLKEDFNDPESAIIATEFGCTSITSGGDGTDLHQGGKITLVKNPHTKFTNAQRGYVLCRVTPESWQTDFRVVPYVVKPKAPITTRASFVVENGKPGAVEVQGM